MVESKENVKVKSPLLSICSINQNIFFNLYEKISGVSGTLGEFKWSRNFSKALSC